jgi:exodeoxyribonuclease-5
MDNKFSPQQLQALIKVKAWFNDPDSKQVFRLLGYAGTGKTTLAKHIAETFQGDIKFAAYTGKAALVMRQMGCREASTIHSLIYCVKDKSKTEIQEIEEKLEALIQKLKDSSSPEKEILEERIDKGTRILAEAKKRYKQPSFHKNPDSALVYADGLIIDEASMINEQMALDLLSYGKKILVLGDPGQLKPVRGKGFFMQDLELADVMLTEIHRQAEKSPVIQLATQVRNGEELVPGYYGTSRIMHNSDKLYEELTDFDQIIVGTNKLKAQINRKVRQLLGFTDPLPVPGDKLICLRNNHEIGLLNGSFWSVINVQSCDGHRMVLELSSPEMNELIVEVHAGRFRGEEIPYYEIKEAQEFDFGYAITVHKAQGSQWSEVLLIDQSEKWPSEAQEWLYTGITRAIERVVIWR